MKQKINTLILTAIAALCFNNVINAQKHEGTNYFLPKTAIDIYVTIEKTEYTPGDFCQYSERFFKDKKTKYNKYTEYKITSIRFNTIGVPDTARLFSINPDAMENIDEVKLSDNGILLAINDEPETEKVFSSFKSSPATPLPNPQDYMTQDILATGNKIKMAELIAEEIYDIRDSRNQLTRGQADYMPKDGEQLKIMLDKMELQENALMSLFEGTTTKDTSEIVFRCVPEGEINKHLIYRFSKFYGITDSDDLSGEPYYISVKSINQVSQKGIDPKIAKRTAVYTIIPGKISITLFNRQKELANFELYAAQYGILNSLTNDLFNKKMTSSIVLNPTTGNLDKINKKLKSK